MSNYNLVAEKGTWKDDFIKLKQLTNRYEISLATVINRNDDFKHSYVVSQRYQKDEQTKLLKKLEYFKNELTLIQQQLHELYTANIGTDGLQSLLENFEGKISNYKKIMREQYGNLLEEQRICSTDIELMAERIEEWESVDNEKKSKIEKEREEAMKKRRKSVQEKQNREIERQAEVGQIEKDLATIGGRTGGWDNTDHDVFLRIWTQTVTNLPMTAGIKNTFIKRVCPLLPGKIFDEIEEHINFHITYLGLMERKKVALNKWKEERQKYHQKLDDEGRHLAETGIDIPGSPNRIAPSSPAARLEKKRQIAAWKAEKIAKEEADKKEQQIREAEKKKMDIENKRAYQKQTMFKIDEWRRQEAAAKERLAAAAETVRRPTSVDPHEIARRQARDAEFIAKQNELRKAAKDKSTIRERKQAELHKTVAFKGDVPVTRDTERLLAPTTATESYSISKEERIKAAEQRSMTGAHESALPGSGRDLVMGGRAKAGWMSGGGF